MTTTLQPIPLTGCRHDVLGHALKAIGVLRAISTCAAQEDCDPNVEGWWNPDSAAFMICSARYPDAASLVKFFAENYRPTPIIAAWNKSGGVTQGNRTSKQAFIRALLQLATQLEGVRHVFSPRNSAIAGDLTCDCPATAPRFNFDKALQRTA